MIEHTKDTGVRLGIGMFLIGAASSSPAIEEFQRRGVPVVVLRQKHRYDPFVIPQALRIARDRRVAILESHSYKPAVIAFCLRLITGLPWIAFVHGYTSENWRMALNNRLDRWLMRWADLVVVVSAAQARILEKSKIAKKRIQVIHNAVDPRSFQPWKDGVEFRRVMGVGPDGPLVGVVGRLSPEKGQALFVRAFKKVAREVPNAIAVLIGEGQELKHLQSLVAHCGLQNVVKFAGYLDDMSSIYPALDLVVIPSFSEGLPNVLLEAMLHCKAVVATRVGGIPDVMDGELSRFLVNSGDVGALADGMISALRDPQVCKELGEAGAKHAREKYGPKRRVNQIITLYEKLLAGSGKTG
jgi:glycosyltransferase involved in cell wall biosynthesis